jgi:hypothetical protein
MARLAGLRTGFARAQASESTGNTSPLYSVSLFALMTTIMTDIERPHYIAIPPLPLSTFVSCFTSGSVLHSHEQACFDDERSWAQLGIHMYHASPPAHALSRTPFNSWLFQAPLCKIHFELNTNATALLGSLLWAVHTLAAAFLRRGSTTGFLQESTRLPHCAYFRPKPDLWRQPFGTQAFLDSEASQEPSNRELALCRASKP